MEFLCKIYKKRTNCLQLNSLLIYYFRYDEIRNVSFERSGGSTRSFDISVLTNNDIGYTFSSIEKNEYQKLYDYFKNKKITVKAQGSGGKGGTLNFDEDEKVDHYLEGKHLLLKLVSLGVATPTGFSIFDSYEELVI